MYKNALIISNDLSRELQAIKIKDYIFNHNEYTKKNDKKRLQKPFRPLTDIQRSFKVEFETFISNKVSDELSINNMVLLRSLSGCQQQAPHTDYVPTPDLVDLLECDEKIPLLAIAAIMPGTKINVWPNSIRKIHHTDTLYEEPIMCKTLEMDVGDVLIFRADLVHAGSSYDTENTRVHVYLDSPYVKRNPNKTWVIKSSYNKNNALKEAILPPIVPGSSE